MSEYVENMLSLIDNMKNRLDAAHSSMVEKMQSFHMYVYEIQSVYGTGFRIELSNSGIIKSLVGR